MGASKCTQCCDRGVSEKIPCGRSLPSSAPPPGWPQPKTFDCERISGLSYSPPPARDDDEEVQELLGALLPQRPEVLSTGQPRSRHHSSGSSAKHQGRPGEPVNKVYAQFSNDLEGFLPYTLVISDELGLEFKPVGDKYVEFRLDPLNVLKAACLDFDTLSLDPVFSQLRKAVSDRPDRASTKAVDVSPKAADTLEAERVRPPYNSIVRLGIRCTVLEGSQVLVFISVQSERLATELIRSCEQLRRRRAILYYGEPCYEKALDPNNSRCTSSRQQIESPPSEERYRSMLATQGHSDSEEETRSRLGTASVSSPTRPASGSPPAAAAPPPPSDPASPSSTKPTTPPAISGHITDTLTSTSSVLPNYGDTSPQNAQQEPQMARPG